VKFGLGCVALLAVLGVVTYFIDQSISTHLPPELRLWVAVSAAVFLTLGLSNFWMIARGYGRGDASRAAVLERAHMGMPPEHDGPLVVTGVVRPDSGTLRAPISDTECVAYMYRLYTIQGLRHRRRYREVPIYWGYSSRSFYLDSPSHAYRVMAFPQMLDKTTSYDSPEARARARAYVAATPSEPMDALVGVASSAASILSEILHEPSGDTRRDWRAANVNVDIEKLQMEENLVPVGATVSVSGRWSAERGAIVPGVMGEGQIGVTLVAGPAENLGQSGASELPSSVMSVAVTGAMMLSIGGAIAWLASTGRIAEWWRLF
jgi:hypothetical protein